MAVVEYEIHMVDKTFLDNWHKTPDPWGYKTTPDDAVRKAKILNALGGVRFEKALDIGAGEGWITKDLPAETIHAIELSDIASERIEWPVTRVPCPIGTYDLITATGVLYDDYEWESIIDIILKHATGTILTCNIASWEKGIERLGRPVFETTFPYRTYKEHLCIFSVTT